MRSIWSGSINFGLVNIPVKLYTAVKSSHLYFNYLRKDDLCSIGYLKVCRKTGEEVSKEEIVRSYEYQKGDYVILDENDFKEANIETSYAITIEDFVAEKEVDIIYAEKPYYLEPEKESKNVYALFREALLESKKVGIGKFILKEKEHLGMLKTQEDLIVLVLIRFPSEILSPESLDIPKKIKVPRKQIELALELIDKLSGPFKLAKYKDTYTEKLKEIIEAKKKGKKITVKESKT